MRQLQYLAGSTFSLFPVYKGTAAGRIFSQVCTEKLE